MIDFGMRRFFIKNIKGTAYKSVIINDMFILCSITEHISKLLLSNANKYQVKISSRCLKHLYDRKPAEEFIFLLDHLYEIVKNPMHVYFNKSEKRGTFGLVKNICGADYFCSVETTKKKYRLQQHFVYEIPVT